MLIRAVLPGMREHGITREEARQRIADTLPARRFGRPEEFGAACAFLCGAQSGFMTGQNLQLDGGLTRAWCERSGAAEAR